VSGFAVHGKLTKTEIEAIPDLIALRVLSNVVYFVGRAIAKEDSIDSLTTRAESYANRVRWIFNNRQAIVDMITTKMAVKDASLLNA
jgi:Ser/Thr protein kinase RdoA (MazF antagonist)